MTLNIKKKYCRFCLSHSLSLFVSLSNQGQNEIVHLYETAFKFCSLMKSTKCFSIATMRMSFSLSKQVSPAPVLGTWIGVFQGQENVLAYATEGLPHAGKKKISLIEEEEMDPFPKQHSLI